LDTENKEFIKEWYWRREVPTPDAANWNCKIKVEVKKELAQKYASKIGVILLLVESYGFDKDIFLMV